MASVWRELKRRNVVRVAVAYAIVSWLILQLTDVLVPMLNLPESVGRLVFFLLLVGFPLAMFFAWAYELTPEGIKKEKDVDRSESITHMTGRKLDFIIIAVMALAIGYFAYDGFVIERAKDELTVPGFGGRPAIAVLPFQNLSGDPEQEYFADGIAEDLITRLSLWRSFPVIARNSSFVYKGQAVDVKRVGHELGVRYVVEGSVRRAGDQIRITAQLIDSTTDHHVWAHTYDRDLADVFAVQDEISSVIAATLLGEVERAEGEHALRRNPESLEAWDLHQRALWHYHRQTAEDNKKAKAFLKQALKLDPYFAGAYSRLAAVHFWDIALGWTDSPERSLQEMLRNARRSVDFDPRDPIGQLYLGAGFSMAGDGEGALAAGRRAVELNPSSTEALAYLGWVLAGIGQADEAIRVSQRGLRLNAHGLSVWLNLDVLAFSYFVAGRYPEAVEASRRLIEMRPDYLWGYLHLAASFARLDRPDEARSALEEALRVQPDRLSDVIRITLAFGDPTVVERYIEALRKAGLEA